MKVRVLISFAGLGFTHNEGDVIDLPEDADWLKAGLVEPLEAETETAVLDVGETATMPRKRNKATPRSRSLRGDPEKTA